MDKVPEDVRREGSRRPHIRSLAYNLLKEVRFSNEPVVPKIVFEGKDEIGEYRDVEKLSGMDIGDFLNLPDSEASLLDKFSVMLHLTRQLQEIDKAGYVLSDRNPGNMRVLSWKDKISTRQIDLEEFYDKKHAAPYSADESYIEMVDIFNKKGIDLWVPVVNELIYEEGGAAKRSNRPDIANRLLENEWAPPQKKTGSNLYEHEKVLLQIIDNLKK